MKRIKDIKKSQTFMLNGVVYQSYGIYEQVKDSYDVHTEVKCYNFAKNEIELLDTKLLCNPVRIY